MGDIVIRSVKLVCYNFVVFVLIIHIIRDHDSSIVGDIIRERKLSIENLCRAGVKYS